jgi:16S rRNA (uracil1498-N3)-methyltransferase
MPRFFINEADADAEVLQIEGDDARHIARSLRMAVGDSITVCDGSGNEFLCRLEKIRDELCLAAIISKSVSKSESPSKITLFMAYPKSDKLETVIQKAVELGAYAIVPFESSRCIKRPSADKAQERTARLSRIAEEAAKQCGRAILPRVSTPISYKQMLSEAAKADMAIFCYEGEGTLSLKSILDSVSEAPRSISVIVGSEGGFSPEEALRAKEAGFLMASLGPRILRCETAPDYALSAISYRFEL